MNIFLSYSVQDTDLAYIITSNLNKNSFSVQRWDNPVKFQIGNSPIEQIQKALDNADVLMALITDSYLSSPSAQAELTAALFGPQKCNIVLIVVGDVKLPSFLADIQYTKVSEINEEAIAEIALHLQSLKPIGKSEYEPIKKTDPNNEDNHRLFISDIRQALMENRLSFVFGAGISIDMGIPDWNTLLLSVLNTSLQKDFKKNHLKAFPASSLILGKYLKILLGDNFEKVLRTCLYDSVKEGPSSLLLSSIVNLIRPKRNNGHVESIITFNFDSAIEDILGQNNIPHKAIYDEGMDFELSEIPIYHVHGYLPRADKNAYSQIVLSEDAYHTQFMDPFSWANLIQLYKYMNNICLFIGLSLHDPNLRRLLDISVRKNTREKLRHYIVKKRRKTISELDNILLSLEEQDANALGLNVIWVNEYEEIPRFLNLIQ